MTKKRAKKGQKKAKKHVFLAFFRTFGKTRIFQNTFTKTSFKKN